MIVAEDGNPYVPYAYSNTTNSPDGSSSQIVSTFNLLRVSPDGSYAKIQLDQETQSATGIGTPNVSGSGCGVGVGPSSSTTQDPQFRQFVGTDPSDPPGPISVITNGNTGVAVFSAPTQCAGQPSTVTTQTQMRLVANDSLGLQSVLPLGSFTPTLQREDGSYIGTDSVHTPAAVDLGGNVLWHTTSLGGAVTPLYATADAGAIFTSGALSNCSQGTEVCTPFTNTPTLYAQDQNGNPAVDANGNPIPPAADTGARTSWTANWYVGPSSSVSHVSLSAVDFPTSYAASIGGNPGGATGAPGVYAPTLGKIFRTEIAQLAGTFIGSTDWKENAVNPLTGVQNPAVTCNIFVNYVLTQASSNTQLNIPAPIRPNLKWWQRESTHPALARDWASPAADWN